MTTYKNIKYTDNDNQGVLIGQKLKTRRKLMKLTQKQLADAVGVTFQQIQKYEAGINKISLQLLIKFCKILYCNINYFLDEPSLSDVSVIPSIQNNMEEDLLLAFRNIKNIKIKNAILELIKQLGSKCSCSV